MYHFDHFALWDEKESTGDGCGDLPEDLRATEPKIWRQREPQPVGCFLFCTFSQTHSTSPDLVTRFWWTSKLPFHSLQLCLLVCGYRASVSWYWKLLLLFWVNNFVVVVVVVVVDDEDDDSWWHALVGWSWSLAGSSRREGLSSTGAPESTGIQELLALGSRELIELWILNFFYSWLIIFTHCLRSLSPTTVRRTLSRTNAAYTNKTTVHLRYFSFKWAIFTWLLPASPVRYIDMTYRLSIYRHFWKISISISISIWSYLKISISIRQFQKYRYRYRYRYGDFGKYRYRYR